MNADLCIKCSQLRHTALHPLAMASLRDVFELVSAEFVLNLGIVGSVRLFAVSSRWNQLADAAWAALKVLRLTDNASIHVECHVCKYPSICVADCTLLQWSRLPVEQQRRWSAQKQTLILYVRTPGRIIGPTLWRPEYAEHFSSLNFLALIHVRQYTGSGGDGGLGCDGGPGGDGGEGDTRAAMKKLSLWLLHEPVPPQYSVPSMERYPPFQPSPYESSQTSV